MAVLLQPQDPNLPPSGCSQGAWVSDTTRRLCGALKLRYGQVWAGARGRQRVGALRLLLCRRTYVHVGDTGPKSALTVTQLSPRMQGESPDVRRGPGLSPSTRQPPGQALSPGCEWRPFQL